MSDRIPFTCPQCGGTKFSTPNDVKVVDDFIGAICADCGTTLTKDEIERQARKIAEDVAKRNKFDTKF